MNDGVVYGMVLVQHEHGCEWIRVDQDFNTVDFDIKLHGTWNDIKTVYDEDGEFVVIPITWVKTEKLTKGPYVGNVCWWTADRAIDGFHVHSAFYGKDEQPCDLYISSWLISKNNNKPFSIDKGLKRNKYWTNVCYNDIHNFVNDKLYPYSIYTHHLLARLMLTEFGTPDIRDVVVDNMQWDCSVRIAWHGIHDPFGLPNYELYFWLYGLTTNNGTYQVLSKNNNIVDTNLSISGYGWPQECYYDEINGINFGDMFIASKLSGSERYGNFMDFQYFDPCCAFCVGFGTQAYRGAFALDPIKTTFSSKNIGWRTIKHKQKE